MAMAFINSLALRTSRQTVQGPEEGAGPGRLAPGARRGRVKRRYEILESVGKGSFGKVNRGVEKMTGKKVSSQAELMGWGGIRSLLRGEWSMNCYYYYYYYYYYVIRYNQKVLQAR